MLYVEGVRYLRFILTIRLFESGAIILSGLHGKLFFEEK